MEITLLKSPKEKVEYKALCLNENEFKHEILELLSFNTLAIKQYFVWAFQIFQYGNNMSLNHTSVTGSVF